MLWTPGNSFLWTVGNQGAVNFGNSMGTSVAAAGSANTKGSDVEILSDTVLTEDCYLIAVGFVGGSSAASGRNFLVDIKSDPTGGTTWGTIIPNLLTGGPDANALGGEWYYFPLYIKAGTALAAAVQSNVAAAGLRVYVQLFGKPTRPDLVKAGSFVRAYGVNTGTTEGTAITPGSTVFSSYVSLASAIADNIWWWQAGMGVTDSTQTAMSYLSEIAAGDVTNKITCLDHHIKICTAAEQGSSFPLGKCQQDIPSGANVYARSAASSGAGDTGRSIAAYGLGG